MAPHSEEAARNKLEADMLDAGGIGSITTCLSQGGVSGSGVLQSTITGATYIINRPGKSVCRNGPGRWKCYMPYGGWMKLAVCKARRYYKRHYARPSIAHSGCVNPTRRPEEKEFHAHLHSWQALCHILRDLHSGVNLPGVSLSAAVALLERCSQAVHAPALDRGAALGALMRLEHPNASAEAALTMLAQLSPAQSGEALHGFAGAGPPSTGLSAGIYRRFQ